MNTESIKNIQNDLISLSDNKYKAFHSKLIPTVNPETVLGVRVPLLRKYADKLYKSREYQAFLCDLPHRYYDEYQLHSFLVCKIRDFDLCIKEIEKLLPYVDNWAVCDSLRPISFSENKDKLILKIFEWIKSEKPYTVRLAIEMLMCHFLEDDFDEKYFFLVSSVRSDDYYVKMMISWYFATALSYRFDEAVKLIEGRKLSVWVHNKTIQKACESLRISEKDKTYLRTLKIKK